MPTTTRSVAASLALHGALLGFAAGGPKTAALRSTASLTALEAAIAIESTTVPAMGTPASTASDSSAAAHGSSPGRARPARAAAARSRPSAPPPSPAVVAAPTANADPAPPSPVPAQPELPSHPDLIGSTHLQPAIPTAASGTAGLTGTARSSAGVTTAGIGQPSSGSKGPTAPPQLAGYLKSVRERVTQHREYPYLARRANLEGTVCLRVSIGASGSVLDVTPTCGARHAPLLQAALKSVSSAAPFPPLPAALGQRLTVDVPVVFELDAL